MVGTAEPDMRIRVGKIVHARIKVLTIRRSNSGRTRLQLHDVVDDVLSSFCDRFRSASGNVEWSSGPEQSAPIPQDETTTIRVTPALQAELKEIATVMGRSLQDLVTGVLNQYCDQYESASKRPLLPTNAQPLHDQGTEGRQSVK